MIHQRMATAYPAASVLFQWVMGVCALVLSGGGVLDDWAHFHGLVDQSFFTPWHAVMYGMMAALGIGLGTLALLNLANGYHWTHTLPLGYMLSLVGVIVFVIAGFLDLSWHLLFGIEHDTAAFVSPTHILLCIGGLLAGTGPLRASWLTLDPRTSRGWRAFGPMLLSATAALVALSIFTQFASPLNDTFASKSMQTANSDGLVSVQSFGVAQIIVQTGLLMGMILLLTRMWALPFGAMTLLIGAPSVAQLLMHDSYWLIASVAVAGIIADLLLLGLRPPLHGSKLYCFAAVTPAIVQITIYFLLGITAGLDWPVTIVSGSVVYAAATGLFIAFLLDWPVRNANAKPPFTDRTAIIIHRSIMTRSGKWQLISERKVPRVTDATGSP